MAFQLDLRTLRDKRTYPLGEDFRGIAPSGDELSLTNYYFEKNGAPYFGVSGEFHFSRVPEDQWEDELIKMKLGGVGVVASYLFWIHHEEEEGKFRFDGRRDLRRFVELCAKHGLYVILRAGPFAHGEVRNGGLPDWLYGKPFEARSLDEGFLVCVKRFYAQIGQQVRGLFFRDGGPIIGVQLDNEYMHSSSPWEITSGASDEWIPAGRDGDAYLLRLKELAAECGLLPPFYTCTAWGGASSPEPLVALWGGYAFRPWVLRTNHGDHPPTEEYVYQDYHNNAVTCTDDFQPAYPPETRPYACCEIGGGMMCNYYYRFRFPYRSVDAMANIKLGSGCNFLGYYMFHGGSNPTGARAPFLNEIQVPKITYDYQAPLGEFGQARESYRRLKSIHYFLNRFGGDLCPMQTVLPEGASRIAPTDTDTLRYAVRTDGRRGFLFLNNYQDHFDLPDRRGDQVTLQLDGEALTWDVDLAGGENTILPFHLDMDGVDLIQASVQPVTRIEAGGEITYVFLAAGGMRGRFVFEPGVQINGGNEHVYTCGEHLSAERFTVEKSGVKLRVLVLSRELSDDMFLLGDGRLLFTGGVPLEGGSGGLRLESTAASNLVHVYPADGLEGLSHARRVRSGLAEYLGAYLVETAPRQTEVHAEQVGTGLYTVRIPDTALDGVKDTLLQIEYSGNIGTAFLNGQMIHDNFANGAVWEIGLRQFAEKLKREPVTLRITPLQEGSTVTVESAATGRSETGKAIPAELKSVRLQPVYQIPLD